MGISDKIETFICELVKNDDGWVELGRNEFAGIFNCVPSQINYVMRTRFTPERGYAVESRRGGGGYIRIRRIAADAGSVIEAIPGKVTQEQACEILRLAAQCGMTDMKTAGVIAAGVTDSALDGEDIIRAALLKAMLSVAVRM